MNALLTQNERGRGRPVPVTRGHATTGLYFNPHPLASLCRFSAVRAGFGHFYSLNDLTGLYDNTLITFTAF